MQQMVFALFVRLRVPSPHFSHTTECFRKMPWYFSGRQRLGMRDVGAE